MMKPKNGYDWNSKASDYPYLKNSDSQIVPFKIIKNLVSCGKVNSILDIGCFTGAMAELVVDLNTEYLGFDISDKAVETAKSRVGLQFEVGDFGSFECGNFDLIYIGGLFIYSKPRYDDSIISRYLAMCQPKYILCSDVVRNGYETAYPNLRNHTFLSHFQTYRIDSKRNRERFLCLFTNEKDLQG